MGKDINAILKRAKRLNDMEVSGELDMIAENAMGDGRLGGMMREDGTEAAMPKRRQHAPVQRQQPVYEQQQYMQQMQRQQQQAPVDFGGRGSGLPREILESFQKNTIDTSALGAGVSGSILDAYNIDIPRRQQQPVQQPVVEQQVSYARPQAAMPQAPAQGGVDYSLIRMIVEDTVKKYMGAMQKKILKECASGAAGGENVELLKIGKTFKFVDANGNLFEATLKFKKNLNEGK